MKKRTLSLTLAITLILVSAASFGQKPDRSSPPAPGPAPSLKLPPLQRFTLSNGIPVLLMEKHNVPVVELQLLLASGSVLETPEHAGLVSMTTSMMMEGAGSRGSLELADAIDYLGADLGVSAGLHSTTASLHCPVSKFDSALAILADIVMRPTFPQSELDRLRKERLTALLQRRDEPRVIASALFDRTLYGVSHPYGMQHFGTKQSIESITVSNIKALHGSLFHAGNATFIVAGDVSRDDVRKKLEALFGRWKAKPKQPDAVAPAEQVKERGVFFVDKPGAAQSVIRIGHIGVPRLTEDYYALTVMNTILGGSFSSRLNQNLRETHGYSYGAFSSFSFRPAAGPFTASSDVQTAVTDKALTEFMNELRGILNDVPDEELTRAKNYVALGYPKDFQTTGDIAGALQELVLYNLPDDYFNGYIGRILSVTKEDVQRVAKKYIDPHRIAIIVVGDREKVLEDVKALNLGPIHEYTIEDVLGE